MAKKTKVETTDEEVQAPDEAPVEDNYNEEADDPTEGLGALDFNVSDEYKPDPLTPKGTYYGAVVKVSFNPDQHCIIWEVVLHDNGGLQSDGESQIDGAHQWFRNWLPRPGDEDTLTKSGKSTKRQSKINMLKNFAEAMKIDISTPAQIAAAISEAQWIGLEVEAEIDIDEYLGKFRNVINRMKVSKMYG